MIPIHTLKPLTNRIIIAIKVDEKKIKKHINISLIANTSYHVRKLHSSLLQHHVGIDIAQGCTLPKNIKRKQISKKEETKVDLKRFVIFDSFKPLKNCLK